MLAAWGCRLANQARIGFLLGPNVQLRCTTYYLAKVAEQIRASSYPQADDFAARNVLQPPLEKEMLEAFGKAELK